MSRLSHKTKQLLWAMTKILVVIVAGYFIYSKLDRNSFDSLILKLSEFSTISLYSYIIIILFLTLANWFLEIKKWQTLISFIKDIPLRESIRQTLTAHLIGFITPAKAGDYGAKALFYNPEDRKKVLFLNFIGNMYQLKATITFGFLGLGIIALFTSGAAIFFWGLALFMTLVLYQIIPKVLRYFNWTLKGNAWYKIKKFWKTIPLHLKKKVQFYSFVRYVIFAHQFYFILWVFGADVSYLFGMACIMAMYLLSSLVPVMQLVDVIVRGGVAVWVFSWFTVSEDIVLMAVFLMWLFNMVLPLMLGSYFLLTTQKPENVKTTSE